MVKSLRDNPRGTIFAEPAGVVCFDPVFAEKIRFWNKKKEKLTQSDPNSIIPESQEEIDELNNFIPNHKFYTFHGEHRRAATLKLHDVSLYFPIT